jgi:hypothetical protein
MALALSSSLSKIAYPVWPKQKPLGGYYSWQMLKSKWGESCILRRIMRHAQNREKYLCSTIKALSAALRIVHFLQDLTVILILSMLGVR